MREIVVKSKVHGTKVIQVDDLDYAVLSSVKWKIAKGTNTYYAEKTIWVKINGKRVCRTIKMHRYIMGLIDSDLYIDHVDHNGLNNQRSNLRPCQNHENIWNTSSRKNSSSKYLGVSWKAKNKKWQVLIQKDGKCEYVGLFEDEREAALKYNERAKQLFGDFANLNQVA